MGIRCDGTLSQDINGYPICDGSWIEEPDVLAQLYELLSALFSTPDTQSVATAFMAAFSLPMICYLTAWALGSVVDFASRDQLD